MMKFGFFHLCVNDLEAMSAWYRDVVGMTQNFDSEKFKGFVTDNGFFFNMSERTDEQNGSYPPGINGTMNIGFNVPTHKDVGTEYARLIKGGAKALTPPKVSWKFCDAYLADPEGNIIIITSVEE
jgi:catechol-2,3-dioxygenase